MRGPSDFMELLELVGQMKTADLPDKEKADVIAVAREFFLCQSYDERLMAIAERITAPPPPQRIEAPAVIEALSYPGDGEGDTETVPTRDEK